MAGKHIQLSWEYIKIALKTASEYRINTIIQVVSMMLNDVMWIIFWYIFYSKVNTLNGWTFGDMMILYAVLLVSFGLTSVLFGNRNAIAGIIFRGELDFYLSTPRNPLYHMLVTKPSWFDVGDVIVGLTLAAIVIPLAKVPLFIALVAMGIVIWASFGVLAGSMTFFLGNSEETSRQMFYTLLVFAERPMTIYSGVAKLIVLSIIPAGFVAGIPAQLLKSFDWYWFGATFLAALVFLVVSILIFFAGLRRYESGNMMTVRT